jgi:hypothetical protein
LEPRAQVVYVDAHHFAQKCLRVLPVAKGVALAAPVAQPEVEKSIRPKGKLSGFVVLKVPDLVHCEKNALARRIGRIRISSRHPILGNHRLNLTRDCACVVNVELAVLGKAGMKGQPEQPHFRARGDLAADIQKGLRQ